MASLRGSGTSPVSFNRAIRSLTRPPNTLGLPWAEVDAWRKELHRDFEQALAGTKLPERPDYEATNRFLIKGRREMAVV